MTTVEVVKVLNRYADALEAWLIFSKDNILTPFAEEAIPRHLAAHPDIDYLGPASLA